MTAYITLFKSTPSDRRFKWALFFSCVLHGIILILLIAGTSPEKTQTIYYSPVYSVNLVGMPAGGLPSGGASSQQHSGTPQQRMEKISLWDGGSTRLTSESRTISERQHPILTFTQKEPAKTPQQMQAGREHGQGRSNADATGNSQPGSGTGTGTGVPGSGGRGAGGAPSQSASEMRFAHYYQSIWERIQSAWAFPAYDKSKSDMEAILVIKIARNGKIVESRFEKRSGDPLLDNSAMRAIQKADPLPPLPESFRENFMELGIRFMPGGVM